MFDWCCLHAASVISSISEGKPWTFKIPSILLHLRTFPLTTSSLMDGEHRSLGMIHLWWLSHFRKFLTEPKIHWHDKQKLLPLCSPSDSSEANWAPGRNKSLQKAYLASPPPPICPVIPSESLKSYLLWNYGDIFSTQLDSNLSVSLLWGFYTSWQQIGIVTEWPQNHCDRCAYKPGSFRKGASITCRAS